MKNEHISKKKIAVIFITITLLLTWVIQFIPLILGMNVSGTSVSSFDASSVFFTIGGMLPSLLGGAGVLILYDKTHAKDFFVRCFVPNKRCVVGIFISLALISFESFVTQMISKSMGAESLGFEGLTFRKEITGEKIPMEKWNPNGGAIAIGHPNGASGARIAIFAMKQLERTGGKYGVFSSCCGGGHGTTTIIENLRR